MITGFDAANGAQCLGYVTDLVKYMAANEEHIGWTRGLQANNPCCSDSGLWGSLEPGSTAADGSPGLYDSVWMAEVQPLVPATFQKRGISSVNGPGMNATRS